MSDQTPLFESLKRQFQATGAQIAAAFVVSFAIMSYIQFAGQAILDNDGYYHVRWAERLADEFPRLPKFQALPLTTLNETDYVDHHYLFHLLLIPFTAFDLRTGAKLAAATFASLGITSLFALLVIDRLRFRWVWLAPLIASSEPFLYRMAMTRAPALSLALLGLGCLLILKRKYVSLAVLSFAFVWLYSLFPLIFVFAVAHTLAIYLAEKRIDLRAAFASLTGISLGLVINPYFPQNIFLFRDHLAMKLTAQYAVDVGIEWYPYESWTLVTSSALAFALYIVGLLAFQYRWRRRDIKPLFFFFISVALLVMACKSRRFIEYWPPFAVLFAASALSPHLAQRRGWNLTRLRDQIIASISALLLALVVITAMLMSVIGAHNSVADEADPYAYYGASKWLQENTPQGTRIFNTDWDDFPMLYYYNPHHAYVAGLDPTYLYDRDPQLWKDYEQITLGKEKNPAPIIRGRFGADYIFTDNYHTAFLEVAEASGDFEIVHADDHTTVLKIR